MYPANKKFGLKYMACYILFYRCFDFLFYCLIVIIVNVVIFTLFISMFHVLILFLFFIFNICNAVMYLLHFGDR